MSTRFYLLREPVTELQLKKKDGRTRVDIWLRGQKAGSLMVSELDLTDLILTFKGKEAALRVGKKIFPEVPQGIPPTTQLISEYGELTTLGELMEATNK